MQFSSKCLCECWRKLNKDAVTGNWFANIGSFPNVFNCFFFVFFFLKTLFGFAHQISGASEVNGLATIESTKTGNWRRSFRASIGNEQLDHFGRIADSRKSKTSPTFLVQCFDVGVMLQRQKTKIK